VDAREDLTQVSTGGIFDMTSFKGMMNPEMLEKSCIRCGRCMSVCPVYQTTFLEMDVARGRLAVLEKQKATQTGATDRLKDILSRCLLCGACADVCANSVDTTRCIQKGRRVLADTNMGDPVGRLLVKSLRRGGIPGEIINKGGALFESLCCKRIPEGSGLHLRFPLSFFAKRATVPAISWKPFLKSHVARRHRGRKKRVAFFVGCGANYLFPETAKALVDVFHMLGVSVEIPPEQGCCGLPAYVSGDTEKARELAEKNLRAFESLDVDAVITVCASCGGHIKQMEKLFKDDPVLERYTQISRRHQDAMTFLVEEGNLFSYLKVHSGDQPSEAQEKKRVSYHDPCHLRIAQGETVAPRTILSALPGVLFEEAPHEGRCCGHGGDFNLSHFDISMKILDRRMDDFKRVDPDVITTGCTGCLLQLQEGVGRLALGGKIRVCHPLVLVKEAMTKPRVL
jgi:glycolate oxidase iron-sulfur subunit